MRVYKHTITVTVLSENPDLGRYDLDEIWQDCKDGASIGDYQIDAVEPLDDQSLRAELAKMGHDELSFFCPSHA